MASPILTDEDISRLDKVLVLNDADISKLDNQKNSPIPQGNQYGANTPENMAWDILSRFGKGAYNATSFLPGINNPLANQIYGAVPKASNLGQQIPEALGGVAPTIALANPYIQAARAAGLSPLLASATGFGAFSGSKAALEKKSLGDTSLDALIGAGTGALYGIGGAGGEKLASLLSKPISKLISPIAVKTAGTSIGQAAVGAATAAPDERLSGALVAGGLGALNPSKVVSPEEYNAQISKNANSYRELIPPVPSDIRKIETGFKEKDINDSYKLMAQEGAPILNDNGAKDTSVAIKQLARKATDLESQLNSYLDSNSSRQFNLNDIRTEAKLNIEKIKMPALDREAAMKKVDDYINSEISSLSGQGLILDGRNLNNLKSNMYKVAFNNQAPADAPAARQIASVIKNTIEKAYPQQPIEDTNSQIGKYATAQYLLQKAHGTSIKIKGRMGADIAGGAVGSIVGGLLGSSHSPVLSYLGATSGGALGVKVADLIKTNSSNPELITESLKNRLKDLSVR